MVELFNELPADRALNVIDSIIVEDAIRNGQVEGSVEKARTQIVSIYSKDPQQIRTAEDEFFTPESSGQTGDWHEGLKVNNAQTFRMEKPMGDVDDGISPFA